MYVSIVTSVYGVASAAGPLLGGLFTDSKLTWRFCFWINLPIGFVALVLLVFFLDPPAPTELGRSLTLRQKACRIDFIGTFLLITAFTCFFLAAQWGGNTYAWSDSKVWGCLLGFVLQMAVFAYFQKHLGDRATIPTRILSNNVVLLGLLFQCLVSMTKAIQLYYLPFYFQSALGHNAISSGVLTLPYIMPLLVPPIVTGFILSTYGYYMSIMYLGSILSVAGSTLLTTLNTNSKPAQYIGYQFLAAIGAGMVAQIQLTAVPLALPSSDMATASAVISFSNNLGPVVILNLGNIIFTNELNMRISQIPGLDKGIVDGGINGLVDLEHLVPPQFLQGVREALAFAFSRTLISGISSAGLTLCLCFGIYYIRLKD